MNLTNTLCFIIFKKKSHLLCQSSGASDDHSCIVKMRKLRPRKACDLAQSQPASGRQSGLNHLLLDPSGLGVPSGTRGAWTRALDVTGLRAKGTGVDSSGPSQSLACSEALCLSLPTCRSTGLAFPLSAPHPKVDRGPPPGVQSRPEPPSSLRPLSQAWL